MFKCPKIKISKLVVILFVCWAFGNAEARKQRIPEAESEFGLQDSLSKFMEGPLTNEKKWGMILMIWQNVKEDFTLAVKKALKNRNLTNSLYSIQAQTNNLLKAAVQAKKFEILDKLSELYLITYDFLELKERYVFHYLPNEKGRSTSLRLPNPTRMWTTETGEEVILCSAQFLYLISNAINLFLDFEEGSRTKNMNRLIARFAPVVVNDHYERWLFGTPGVFQVRGWGCNSGVFNHLDFLKRKSLRQFGTIRDVSYCNAVTGIDMWILGGVVEILAAHSKDAQLVPISNSMKSKMTEYVDVGIGLLESRLTKSVLTDFAGRSAEGRNFDLGAWDDHLNNAYSGYSGKKFPTEEDRKSVENIGWDISHARRFVHVFDTLYTNREVAGRTFPDEGVLKSLVNQLAYGVFNRDFLKPLFSNYMDGTNGWYRVNFSGRRGFGYAPYDLSIALITGGYGFWSGHNPDMQRIVDALWKMIGSKDPAIVSHRENHYERNHYRNFKRKRTEDLNSPNSLALLNFLCAYSTSNSYRAGEHKLQER